MTTTHDDSAATWRDLTDQLTADQVEKLAGMEARSQMSAAETAEALLEGAREWAAANMVDRVVFAEVPRPADATRFCMWSDEEGGVWVRTFDGTRRSVGGKEVVFIDGRQYQDGRVERSIVLTVGDDDYDAATARQLAAALIDAADELERLQ